MFGLGQLGKLGAVGRAIAAWTPAQLWPLGASSPGMWIDPPYVASMFQDSAGTTAISAIGTVLDTSNPVGLVLDRKGGLALGPEGVTNGDFSAGTANWTALLGAVLTVTAGVAKVEGVNGQSFSGIRQDTSISTVPGRFVKIAFTVTELSAGAQAFIYCTNGGGTIVISKYITVPGSYVEYAPQGAVSGTGHLLLQFDVRNNYGAAVTGDYIRVDNISVREIPGIHLSQATATSRPVASARKNLLLGTDALATQSVTVIAAQCVLSFTGTGTVTLSGTSTAGPLIGTGAADRVSLTFTPTAGSLTLTVSGSVTLAQLEYRA